MYFMLIMYIYYLCIMYFCTNVRMINKQYNYRSLPSTTEHYRSLPITANHCRKLPKTAENWHKFSSSNTSN